MAAYHRVYDSHHQQADCQQLGSVWAIFTFLIPPADVSSFRRFRHRIVARGGKLPAPVGTSANMHVRTGQCAVRAEFAPLQRQTDKMNAAFAQHLAYRRPSAGTAV